MGASRSISTSAEQWLPRFSQRTMVGLSAILVPSHLRCACVCSLPSEADYSSRFVSKRLARSQKWWSSKHKIEDWVHPRWRKSVHMFGILRSNRCQFIYYIPNVVTQVTTLVFLGQHQHFLKYITTPAATAVASAQALRITRKIWKLGSEDQHEDLAVVQLPSSVETSGRSLAKNLEAGLLR